MNIPSARTSHRRPKAKPSPRAKRTVAAGKLADAVLRYLAEHPQTAAVSITVRGKKFILEPQKPLAATLPKAPSGYFARFYTPELAAEDNRFAAHSTHDPADFIE